MTHATARGVRRFGELRQSIFVTVAPEKRAKKPNRAKRHRLNVGRRSVNENREWRPELVSPGSGWKRSKRA